MADDTEAIHTWFSLTYANYLVLPRSVLQSMPDAWQKGFVEHLEQMDAAFGHLDWPNYEVQALVRERDRITPWEDCEECAGSGIDPERADGDCQACEGEGQVEGEARFETIEEIGVRTDPIPHYERGRTKLTPIDLETLDAAMAIGGPITAMRTPDALEYLRTLVGNNPRTNPVLAYEQSTRPPA